MRVDDRANRSDSPALTAGPFWKKGLLIAIAFGAPKLQHNDYARPLKDALLAVRNTPILLDISAPISMHNDNMLT